MNGSGHYIVDPSSTTHLDEVSCWCCGRAPPRLVSAPSACPTVVADSEALPRDATAGCQRFIIGGDHRACFSFATSSVANSFTGTAGGFSGLAQCSPPSELM
jgi:hypothetical protein